MKPLVPYYRVSTARQGQSGLGLEAQRFAVENLAASGTGTIIAEFTEVESGRCRTRPELAKAIAACKSQHATLVIAKIDRLARNAAFVLSLRDSGVDFIACDMPQADRLTIGILALIAEREAELISQRTKDALAAAKRRGVRLGNPQIQVAAAAGRAAQVTTRAAFRSSVLPVIDNIRSAGAITSFSGIARCLNARGVPTCSGSGAWDHSTVRSILHS